MKYESDTVWVVSYQLPYDKIVGLFKKERDAKAKWRAIPNDHAPIYYPCSEFMVKNQAGYNKRLIIR